MTIQTSIYAFRTVITARPRLGSEPATIKRPSMSMAAEAAIARQRHRKAWGFYATGDGYTENTPNTQRQQQSQAAIAEAGEKVIVHIAAHGPTGTDDLARAINCKPWYIEKAVTSLRRAGRIKSKKKGIYSVWVAV